MGQGRCHHGDYLVFLHNCSRIPFHDLCLTGNARRASIWWSFSANFISDIGGDLEKGSPRAIMTIAICIINIHGQKHNYE